MQSSLSFPLNPYSNVHITLRRLCMTWPRLIVWTPSTPSGKRIWALVWTLQWYPCSRSPPQVLILLLLYYSFFYALFFLFTSVQHPLFSLSPFIFTVSSILLLRGAKRHISWSLYSIVSNTRSTNSPYLSSHSLPSDHFSHPIAFSCHSYSAC